MDDDYPTWYDTGAHGSIPGGFFSIKDDFAYWRGRPEDDQGYYNCRLPRRYDVVPYSEDPYIMRLGSPG